MGGRKGGFYDERSLHTRPESLTFSLYSSEEIKKLSVVNVKNPLSFNALGHPLPGGLYDPAMGPYDSGGVCTTCQGTYDYCPGHFGRIELPLPVINPLFSKTLLTIFRLSCLRCHTVNVPGILRHKALAQLKLLTLGFLKEAQDADMVIGDDLLNDGEGKEKKAKKRSSAANKAEGEMAKQKFQEYVDNVLKQNGGAKKFALTPSLTRNIESVRRTVIKSLLSYAKASNSCPNCGFVCKKMKLYNSQIIYTPVMSGGERGGRRDEAEDFVFAIIGDEEEIVAAASGSQIYLTPTKAKKHLGMLWLSDEEFLRELYPVLQTTTITFPTDLFFVDVVAVPPPRNRAAKMLNNVMVEHQHNIALRQVAMSCAELTYAKIGLDKGMEALSKEALNALKAVTGSSMNEKVETIWKQLQADVDHVMDRERNKTASSMGNQMEGLKQIIEKKEGLFRMHMMGKRVNFAARTVITPDPIIHIEEIGIPDVFAKVLTFPTPVTSWNVQYLRKLIINGPNKHPGATTVELQPGRLTKLSPDNEAQRLAIANRLLAADTISKGTFKGIKTVHRHLMNGDYLLLNRQPSLHRPSIMAHRARVLYGEKVFRLHYANCKHYNADFDGDEMNAHFPQSHIARSEAANLVNVCSHFLVPKDGTPLCGLIQDHVVAAVRMTIRGRFFNRRDYHQLVNFALGSSTKYIETEPPAIIKPEVLWAGKQVISTVIKNLIPEGKVPISFISQAKIKSNEWRQWKERRWEYGGNIQGNDLSESLVIFQKGELLTGVLDKVHMGSTPYGLIHAFYELYGSDAAGSLVTSLSRLMTNFLQWEGFTLGVKDVLVKEDADFERRNCMEEAAKVGPKAAAAGVNLPEDAPLELVYEKLEEVHRSRDMKGRAFVDRCYKDCLIPFTDKINKACIPYGLVSIFPQNNLQLLVQSGAKGSQVNTMQMSCSLGQIELEGKRPALAVSGKSLPSFRAYDITPRAGGYIMGRFLTGIRPQEFFFHCMAGREGLIDTAVKTSRSGYLQRCLVKLLEGVVTQYDGTVRDSDGSVIQFLYGEDGLDVCKSQYLREDQFKFLEETASSLKEDKNFRASKKLGDKRTVGFQKDKISNWGEELRSRVNGFRRFEIEQAAQVRDITGFNNVTGRSRRTEKLCSLWKSLSSAKRKKYTDEKKPDPLLSYLSPHSHFGVVSEQLDDLLERYSSTSTSKGFKKLKDIVYYKAMQALSSPGDAVGVLAAQSIGEPSTQMTLNTFHFAGRSDMNVTLGIPRLREILMVASANIKTPCMEIPFRPGVSLKQAENLRLLLTSVTLAQALQYIEVTERVDPSSCSRLFKLKFLFLKKSEFSGNFCIKPSNILSYFENQFLKNRLLPVLRKASKQKKNAGIESKIKEVRFAENSGDLNPYQQQERRGDGEGHESSDEEPEAEDADATQANRRAQHAEAEYEAPEEEEKLDDDEGERDDEEENENLPKKQGDEEDLDEEGGDFEDLLESAFQVSSNTYEARVSTIRSSDPMVEDYDFDRKAEQWCTVTVRMPLALEKVNMPSLLRLVAKNSVIHQVPKITRAFLDKDKMILKTEGINILAMADHRDLLDLNKLHCNNIHTMAEHYGIEAALKVLVKEMTGVFGAYSIKIDPRHLNLVADYMTFSGTYRPFNRIGMEASASPLQQMSFETVVTFLRDAALSGKRDDLKSPSSRLVTGKPVGVGTGLFTLRQKLSD